MIKQALILSSAPLVVATRLHAMVVKRGSNYPDKQALSDIDSALHQSAKKYTLVDLQPQKGLAVFLYTQSGRHTLLLASVHPGFRWAPQYYLKDSGVTKIVGLMHAFVGHAGEPDTVHAVWVEKTSRGKGLGMLLYEKAHSVSESGIGSSRDIGTMSLATWIRLYQKHTQIELRVNYGGTGLKAQPRECFKFRGNLITYVTPSGSGVNITQSNSDVDFRFVWVNP
jgi:GNAT superfamily N-acetyltransferase